MRREKGVIEDNRGQQGVSKGQRRRRDVEEKMGVGTEQRRVERTYHFD